MRYDLILMDADNTLYDFDAAEVNSLREVLNHVGITAQDAPQVFTRLNAACWLDYNRGLITQDALRLRRFRELLAHYDCPGNVQECSEIFADALSRQCILLPGAYEALQAISENLPVMLLTNGISAVQHRRFDRSPLSPFLSGMLVSEEEGHPKPEPHMFRKALSMHGITDPKRALMIGDSLSSDILGANRAGVDACWFNPKHKAITEDVVFQYEIHSTQEMVSIALQ